MIQLRRFLLTARLTIQLRIPEGQILIQPKKTKEGDRTMYMSLLDEKQGTMIKV